MGLTLKSSAFQQGERIPARFTCDGQDVSPPLAWEGAPSGTRGYALIVDDPDAPGGMFTHWVLYRIPAEAREIPENLAKESELSRQGGLRQGRNDFGRVGYGGPCPPRGRAHRYRFHLYALDQALDLPPAASRKELARALQGHVLAEAELVGLYARS